MAQANGQDSTPTVARVGFKTPQDRQRERQLRKRMALAIERLIDVLDALDAGGEDVEDDDPGEDNGDDEPSLGATLNLNQAKGWGPCHWSHGAALDCELDNADREPSLGSLELPMDQRESWDNLPSRAHDLEEDTADDEPLTGSTEFNGSAHYPTNSDQTFWALGAWSEDLEFDPADRGEPEDGV
jgi:hypothetical protein